MTREYSQKAALVTGGARGIGEATARLLAERGYRVAVCDLHAPRRLAGGLLYVRCDVSREPSVRACVRQVVKRLGRLDALVNNAGIADPHGGPLERLALKAQW
jgi:NAD(P)-dependent dehydrogenase (short-subunit alcohol dehydrogenase family)